MRIQLRLLFVMVSVFGISTFLKSQEVFDDTIYMTDIAWSPDQTKLVAVGIHPGFAIVPNGGIENPGYSPDRNTYGYVSVFDTATGNKLYTVNPSSAFTSVDWSPDGKLLALGSYDGTVWIVDALTGDFVVNLFGHQATVTDVDWNNDGTQLVSSGNWDELVILWNALTYEQIGVLKVKGFPLAIEFSPDSKSIGLGTDSGVFLFPVDLKDTSQFYKNFFLLNGWISSIAFSNDGHYLATGTNAVPSVLTGERPNSFMRIIDLRDKTVVNESESSSGSVRKLSWSMDNHYLAIAYEDNLINIVDFGNLSIQATYTNLGSKRYNIGLEFTQFGGQLAYSNSIMPAQQDSKVESDATVESVAPIIVPIATLDRFVEIAASCGAPASLTQVETGVQADAAIIAEAQTLEVQLDALPDNAIPVGCEADLRAIAEAIKSKVP